MKLVKISNHKLLDDGIKWQIVGRLESGQYQMLQTSIYIQCCDQLMEIV